MRVIYRYQSLISFEINGIYDTGWWTLVVVGYEFLKRNREGKKEKNRVVILKNPTNQQNTFQYKILHNAWENVEGGLQTKCLFVWDLMNLI